MSVCLFCPILHLLLKPTVCRIAEMRLFTLCVILILYGKSVSCAVRTWLPTTNVLNKENWEANSKGCKGLLFPKSTIYPMAMDTLTISKIVLPIDGGMVLNEGATVTLDPRNETCITLKQPEKKSWLDPRNWNPLPNKAIPDLDRIPCDKDTTVFPNYSSYDIYIPSGIRLYLIPKEVVGVGAYIHHIDAFRQKCTTTWDCYCHGLAQIGFQLDLCDYENYFVAEGTNCADPVKPSGHCGYICGAYILLNTITKQIEQYLEDNSGNVDFYISKIIETKTHPFDYQINLVDKDEDNTGFYANKLAKELETLLTKFYKNARTPWDKFRVVTSGPPINPRFFLDMFTVIFGAFLATVVMFVAIFVVYNGLPEKYNFEINLPSMPKKGFRPFIFAKFENKEGGGLILSRGSVGSLVSLEKSFDNPMFNKDLPSTSRGFNALQQESKEDSDEEGTELQDYSKELQEEGEEEVENLD